MGGIDVLDLERDLDVRLREDQDELVQGGEAAPGDIEEGALLGPTGAVVDVRGEAGVADGIVAPAGAVVELAVLGLVEASAAPGVIEAYLAADPHDLVDGTWKFARGMHYRIPEPTPPS